MFMFTMSSGAVVLTDQFSGAVLSGFCFVGFAYSFSDVSGAHMNPCVTFATWLAGKTSNRKSLLYVAAQLLGVTLAELAVCLCFGWKLMHDRVPIVPTRHVGHVLATEVFTSFIFVFVIFSTAFDLIPDNSQPVRTARACSLCALLGYPAVRSTHAHRPGTAH